MSTAPEAFERRYRAQPDPWQFATSAYEQARYATTVDWLGERRYRRAFEPACSIGVLTELLAARCTQVVACDVSATACAAARRRTGPTGRVEVVEAAVPVWWPEGSFDLIVLSEVGYYLDPAGVATLARRTLDALTGRAVVVGVHWLGHSDDHRQHGADVHDELEEVLGAPAARCTMDPLASGDEAQTFVIERWEWR